MQNNPTTAGGTTSVCAQYRHAECENSACACSCHGTLQIKRELGLTEEIPDNVNHPTHYNSHPSGVEVLAIVRWMNFNRGSAVKYIMRAGLKPGADEIEDLQKAVYLLTDEIQRLTELEAAEKQAADRGEYYEDSQGNKGLTSS